MSESAEEDPSSRRGLLLAAGAGVASILAAGCGSTQTLRAQLSHSPPVMQSDVDLLNHLLDLEQAAIAGYTAGTPLLDPSLHKAGALFLNDELAHAGQLTALVKEVGGKPRKPAPSYDLGHPRTSEDVLRLLHDLESAQIQGYLTVIPQLSPGKLRQRVLEALGNDAQHLSVVRALLGRPPVPSAFVTGRE